MSRTFKFLGSSLVGLLAVSGAIAQGPVSNYYLTAGDQGRNWIINGLSANQFNQANPGNSGEYAIAVTPSWVRTLHNGNNTTLGPGSEYNLAFGFTGNTFNFSPSISFYDATTDGSSIYSVDFQSGDVYRLTNTWTSPTVLFNTGFGASNSLGITYDTANNTLWVSQWGAGTSVTQFTLGGTVVSSFNAAFNTISSLAYNPISDTLWMGSQGSQGVFREYSKTGTLLQTQTYAAMASENTLGGEFVLTAAIPEPSTLLLSGMAVVGAGATYLWKRRKSGKR